MKTYGYARVSTKTQSIERQIRNILDQFPEAEIRQEAYTGTKLDRPVWTKLYEELETGDTIVFDSVSRMSRDARDGFALYKELLSENDSPVLAWFDEPSGTVYIQTDANKVYLNEDARYLFRGLKTLDRIDLSTFDTSSVTSMSGMFDGCSSLTELDLSNFDTSSVTDMRWMFHSCNALSTLITKNQAILEEYQNK